MTWATTERRALAETFRAADPGAPTLCTGWDARHLLAHLVQREHVPAGVVGDLVMRRPPGEEKYLGRLVDGARTAEGYASLVQRFDAGPPRWSPLNWAAERISLLEYVIHHEDVRRGAGPVPPRELPAEERDAVWTSLPALVRLSLRKCPVGVVLSRPDGVTQVVKTGRGSVTATGDPVELALWVSGRRVAAAVELAGTAQELATFQSWAATT